jgi:hypothetical protein
VIWAWSESVNLYSWQIIILPRNIKACTTWSGPGPPSGLRALVICTDFPHSRRHWVRLAITTRERRRWSVIQTPYYVHDGNFAYANEFPVSTATPGSLSENFRGFCRYNQYVAKLIWQIVPQWPASISFPKNYSLTICLVYANHSAVKWTINEHMAPHLKRQ